VAELATADGGRVALVLLTHGHADHVAGAPAFAARTGAPVRGAGHGQLRDGEPLDVGGLAVEVLATPGHTADSVSLLVPADRVLLTGDTVLGRGSTVLAWPDGDVGAYLATLERLLVLARDGRVAAIAPGHGPQVTRPAHVLESYRTHRNARLAEVRAAVAGGARTTADVLRTVYGDVGPGLAGAAGQSVRVQLRHLGVPDEDRRRP
jgi:glyoxylase-like metal-dependent hydrolase (beta-lactamase superfamily II)